MKRKGAETSFLLLSCCYGSAAGVGGRSRNIARNRPIAARVAMPAAAKPVYQSSRKE